MSVALEPVTAKAAESGVRAAQDQALTFNAVYDRYSGDVWRALRRLGVAESDIDDAVQDVFVVVHRRLDDFEGRSTVRTWVYGIAINMARTYRRRRQAQPESLLPSVIDARAPDPERTRQANEALTALDTVLASMPDKKREVFVLTEIEELTAPEIAELLEVKLPTVYTRLRAARKHFQRAIRRKQAKAGGSEQ